MLRVLVLLTGFSFFALACDRPASSALDNAPPEPSLADVGSEPEGAPASACTAPIEEGDEDTVTVVFFGDSLTAGFGLADPSANAYPALIEARAREAGWSVRAINAGVSGETTAGGLRRIEWVLGSEPDVDVFVLALGGNDGLRGLAPNAMADNLSGILGCVRMAHPDAALVVAGMEAPPNLGTDYTAQFRGVFPTVAESFDAARVPFLLESVGGVARLNQADGVHPTAEGQRIIAETVWQTLAPILRSQAS